MEKELTNIQKLSQYLLECYEWNTRRNRSKDDAAGIVPARRFSESLAKSIGGCDTVTSWLQLFEENPLALNEFVRFWSADTQTFVKALGADNLASVGIFNNLPAGHTIDPGFKTYYMIGHSEYEQVNADQRGIFLDDSKGVIRAGKAYFGQSSSGKAYNEVRIVFADYSRAEGYDRSCCVLGCFAKGEFHDQSDAMFKESSTGVLRDDSQGTFCAVSRFYATDYSLVNIESPYVFGVLDGHAGLAHASSAAMNAKTIPQKLCVASPDVKYKGIPLKEKLTKPLYNFERDKIGEFKDYLLGKSTVDPFYSGSVRELVHKAKGLVQR